MKLKFDNDWLRRKIAADPDHEPEAGDLYGENMSYSFTVTAPTKAEAQKKIAAEFAGIVKNQPDHAADHDAALAVAVTFVNILEEPTEAQQITVSVHGSLQWREVAKFNGVQIGVSANITFKA